MKNSVHFQTLILDEIYNFKNKKKLLSLLKIKFKKEVKKKLKRKLLYLNKLFKFEPF